LRGIFSRLGKPDREFSASSCFAPVIQSEAPRQSNQNILIRQYVDIARVNGHDASNVG
jgi:hypothetical protein